MYYLCSENKGADQLRIYHAAYLHLCFSLMLKSGFLMTPLSYTESQFAVLSLQILSVNNINFENIDHAEVGLSEAQREKNGLRGFPTRCNTNRALQPQEMARALKFQIFEEEE